MAIRRKTTAKKTAKKKPSRIGGIAAYTRKVQNTPSVKSKTTLIKTLEKKIVAAKKAKAAAVKAARKKLK